MDNRKIVLGVINDCHCVEATSEEMTISDSRLDDLDFVEIVLKCELEFDIDIDEMVKDFYEFPTIKDLIDWVLIDVEPKETNNNK